MATQSSNQSNLIAPGFKNIYSQAMDIKQHPDEYSFIFNVENSDRQYEEESYTSGFGTAPVKLEREEITFDDPIQGPTKRFTHVTRALGFRISEELQEDDLYAKTKQMPKELAFSMKDIVEVTSADVLNNGFNDTAAYRGPDGEPLFGDATTLTHPRLDGGTWQNQLSVAADLGVDSLELALTLLEGTVNDRGIYGRMIAKLLIVPRQLRHTASKLLGSDKEAFTANNQKNAFQDFDLEFMVNHYLTDPDAFFVQAQFHYLKFFWRIRPSLRNDDDFKTGDMLFKSRERFSQGYVDGRGIIGSPGAN